MVTELKDAAYYLATSSDSCNRDLAWVWAVSPGETVRADFVVAIDNNGFVLGMLSAIPPFKNLLIGQGNWFRFDNTITAGDLASCHAAQAFALPTMQSAIVAGKRVCVSIQTPLENVNYAGR